MLPDEPLGLPQRWTAACYDPAMRTASAIPLCSILVCAVIACGGDDGSDSGATTPTTDATAVSDPATSATTDSTTDAGTSTAETSSAGGSSTDAESSSTAAADSTGGVAGDPSYPAPDGGVCPDQTAPITLPGGSVCAPFCAGADAPCPAPASGDATPECTPFADEGGSGTPCTDHGDCSGGEACGADGVCVAVAFWGCRLQCEGKTTCSDGMTCAGGACAYP